MIRTKSTILVTMSRRSELARRFAVLVLGLQLAAGCDARTEEPSRAEGHDCASCHLSDFRDVRDPPHEGARPTTCWVCHSQSAWSPSVVHHRWPLDGAHADAKCFDCHRDRPPVFEGLGSACVDCHRDRYDQNPLPWHARFPTTCADCHSTTAWKPALHTPEPPAERTNAEPAATEEAGTGSAPTTGIDGLEPTPHRTRRARRPRIAPSEPPPVDGVSGASRRLR